MPFCKPLKEKISFRGVCLGKNKSLSEGFKTAMEQRKIFHLEWLNKTKKIP
jgi:hypothetical protein